MTFPWQHRWLGASPIKRSIMLVLGLLVALFVLGMWLMASLNQDFAEDTISDLRQRQIADSFYGNIDRIDAHHHLMEQNTNDLARLAQLFHWQSRQSGRNNTAELESSLTETLTEFPDTFGGGLWFEPDTLIGGPYAVYAYRTGQDIVSERDMAGSYLNRDDYLRLLPAQDADQPERLYHWTSAYYKAGIDTVVVSLSTPIRNRDGETIGIASTDWRAEDIIRLVSRVDVTPGSFSFLLDKENRNLSSLAQADDMQHAQRLMQAISGSALDQLAEPQAPNEIMSSRQLASPMQTMNLTVDGSSYQLFFARTVADMVFGIGVPQAEIDAVLTPMRESNLRVALIIGAIFVVLAALIMLIVASTLRQLSTLYTDSLTGLPNREKLLVELRKTDSAALLLLNIDAFKQINDFYGHECGDHVIRQLAEHMQRFMRTRAAWRNCELYSMPADEMAIVMPGHHTPASLPVRLDELMNFITLMRITWQDHEIPVHASIGAASTVQPDNTRLNGEELLPSASIALKLARLNQSNYFVYDPANRVREAYEQNLIWANALKTALDEGRIVPFFQPIMDVRTGRISKFECLARMLDRKGQPVSPEQFLSIAKKIRLYRYITRTMVDQCFRRFANSRYQFSLNLSCEDLLDADLTEFIFDHLQNAELAQRVIFEILESEGIENYEAVREFIDRAKALGCRIAIDDFGTGYSNFEHLLRLNVDIIKIDGSLIRHLDANDDAMTLTRGIVRFASELGIDTVAEFVHSPEVLEQVRELGIDFAQGAYVGMPAGALITEVELV
ncbi:EAL domain-containing protein [Halopseudomonas nanhaiensis]|uniref:bifunctional diguanylate cyclase/phosphodiesterase n=1 Tax=Halopseudomonas nanhaiensis TaxID=2830842 RepID=UPI001CBEA2CB|nr:EAL domain-containing protein [Halopseudomonas nanhaiensis]UAW99376.1 EAL domain-containing protein [Halopseudomonas nanhaiensis]